MHQHTSAKSIQCIITTWLIFTCVSWMAWLTIIVVWLATLFMPPTYDFRESFWMGVAIVVSWIIMVNNQLAFCCAYHVNYDKYISRNTDND